MLCSWGTLGGQLLPDLRWTLTFIFWKEGRTTFLQCCGGESALPWEPLPGISASPLCPAFRVCRPPPTTSPLVSVWKGKWQVLARNTNPALSKFWMVAATVIGITVIAGREQQPGQQVMLATEQPRLWEHPTAIPKVHARASELHTTTFFPKFSWLERTIPFLVMSALSFYWVLKISPIYVHANICTHTPPPPPKAGTKRLISDFIESKTFLFHMTSLKSIYVIQSMMLIFKEKQQISRTWQQNLKFLQGRKHYIYC